MEGYKKEVNLESILYALFDCKDIFFDKLAKYQRNPEAVTDSEKSIRKEMTKLIPLKYRILIETFGSLPIDQTIDIFSGVAKEFFKTEFENKTTREAIEEFLSKYLKGG
jgi:hypothetical protein